MSRLIEDYGLIGDGETAALVCRDGSIDWLCWPRFDSDACFAALLGTSENGRWQIAPRAPAATDRRYQNDTLVLETEFRTGEGAVRLTDFMPVRGRSSVLIRMVTGLAGEVSLRSSLDLRFDYGSLRPHIELEKSSAVGRVGPDLVVHAAPVPLCRQGAALVADLDVRAGETVVFSLAYGSAVDPPPEVPDASAALAETQRYWREWIGRFDRRTDWPDAVRRSLITLKAMVHRSTGGVVAAPTTSLPEVPGGEMNWDYRYAWLRDATFTLSALIEAGFHAEAREWRNWLMRAIGGEPDKMRIMYRVDGSRRLEEWTPPWLPGFRWTRPVRVGNAASEQLQLDVYGEVLDAVHVAARAGVEPSESEMGVLEAVVRHLESIWRTPDHGLWEVRGAPRHYVYSKASAWVAMDRFLKLKRRRSEDDPEMSRLNWLCRDMHAEICREGYDAGLGRFVEYYGGQTIDASLLLLPMIGFLPVRDPRISGTIAAIERDLLDCEFVRRWSAGRRDRDEGVFLACTCWLADCQFLQGRREAARGTFERVLSVANDLGLLAEQYDVEARHLAGNFPQALSHLALIRTALRLCGPVAERGAEEH